MSPPAVSWTHQHSSALLQVPGGTSFDIELDAGNSFNVNLGLVNQTGSVIRYWLGQNTLSGMEGCPIHLSFDAGVPNSKMGIILFIHLQVHSGGTPMAPGSVL